MTLKFNQWRWGLLALALVGGALWAAAQPTDNPAYNPAKSHHTPNGFQNRYGGNEIKSQWEVMKWQFSRSNPPLPDPPLPTTTPDFNAPGPSTTWLGHSTMLVQMGALRFITDPQFSERASPVQWAGPRRVVPLPVEVAALPKLDVVLISHNHYDHLDTASVQALAAQAGGPPLFIVPLGVKAWFAEHGIRNVVELDWWDRHRVGAVEFVFTPAQHWSSRTPFDRRATLWGGFAALAPDFHLLYTGDTAYSPDFADIRAHFQAEQAQGGFDLALVPIGCYEPRWFMKNQHINPAEAAQIHLDLGAKQSIGVHWGTFEGLCDEPLDQAPKDLAQARQALGVADNAFTTLRHGETRTWPTR
ncbi:MBL fold metallo-hydrolase [Ideonella sp.]|jgi:N-acyl-phosphatidylethanolamine-hydrolysing phospholipase D|uniref:MBL fold metallo-hydrolase n=1 Tax=Ideonella sp. TaxID=1929293 RepID=UPI0037C138A1